MVEKTYTITNLTKEEYDELLTIRDTNREKRKKRLEALEQMQQIKNSIQAFLSNGGQIHFINEHGCTSTLCNKTDSSYKGDPDIMIYDCIFWFDGKETEMSRL